MANPDIRRTIAAQRRFFEGGETKNLETRIDALNRLSRMIHLRESEIALALRKDFNKPLFETYGTELGLVLDDIRHTVKKIRYWARPERVKTPLVHWPARSRIFKEPFGVVLIVAPWNFPFLLSLSPLVGAIAAGNTVILKTAPASAHTSRVLVDLLAHVFPKEYVTVFQGHRAVNRALLREHYDYIFFTGGETVAKLVMKAAAEHLTPFTLELGGKSPVIVHHDANLRLAARRIAWGKFFNGGQTCVAPDYLLVQQSVKDRLLAEIRDAVIAFYGEHPEKNSDYCRIINDKHYTRIARLLTSGKIYHGGQKNKKERFIAPTVLTDVSFDDPVMGEEIFGPVLPVIAYRNLDQALEGVRLRPDPLALYLFTASKKVEQRIVNELRFGGGCVNDTVVHLANPHLPFGGVGKSGMGKYHGKESFDTFTHKKSLLSKSNRIDLPVRYPPYTKRALKLVKLFLH